MTESATSTTPGPQHDSPQFDETLTPLDSRGSSDSLDALDSFDSHDGPGDVTGSSEAGGADETDIAEDIAEDTAEDTAEDSDGGAAGLSGGAAGGSAGQAVVADSEGAASDADADADEGSGDGTAVGMGDDTDAGEGDGAPRRGGRVRLLEKEGEVAADFLERLLDIADLDGDIEVDIDGDRAAVAIVDSEDGRVPRRLVGADGKVLEALQELTRLAVQAETGERSRLMLDVAGHRAQRRTALVELAHTAIAEVKTTGVKKALDDMSAFERKIVHDEVAAAGLESESEGVEPHRHIVVFPT